MRRAEPFFVFLVFLSTLGSSACGSLAAVDDTPPPTAAIDEGDEGSLDEAPAQPSLKDLGEKGRRVTVIVLPGDAAVEVDGVAVRRRDGVIELVGKEDTPRRLRVFKGLQSLEKDVKITATGASPALLDLNAKPAIEPGQGGPLKKGAPDNEGGLLSDEFQ